MIVPKKELKGSILDIGGGGEGVIGRLYGAQVVAIDICREELAEAPDCCEKLLMDATKMTFPDHSFDNVTSFYTLMFMDKLSQQQALCETARVLKPHGEVHIWDCKIDSAYPSPFCIDIEVALPNARLKTTYGIGKLNTQDIDSIIQMCEIAGLKILYAQTNDLHFYIKCEKPCPSNTFSKHFSAVSP